MNGNECDKMGLNDVDFGCCLLNDLIDFNDVRCSNDESVR